MAYDRHTYGKATIGDGGTITHGLGRAPTLVNVTPSVASTFAACTAVTATTITVALKTGIGAGVSQTVYWEAAY